MGRSFDDDARMSALTEEDLRLAMTGVVDRSANGNASQPRRSIEPQFGRCAPPDDAEAVRWFRVAGTRVSPTRRSGLDKIRASQ